MHRPLAATALALAALVAATPPAHAGGRTAIVREAFEQATRRSGREFAEQIARESTEQAIESAVTRYGPRAADAIADGGLELIEASARYGDDVMRIAVEAGPTARRALAIDAGNLVPLVREFGPEALELEAKSPGLARQVFANFGTDDARRIARTVAAEDMPQIVAYANRADTPATRRALLDAYEKEGRTIFERIPPTLVLAGGLSAAMLYGTHRTTAPAAAIGTRIATDPELAERVVDWMAVVAGGLLTFVTGACLWRFGILRRPTHTAVLHHRQDR